MEEESPSGLRPGPGALIQAGASKQQDLGDMAGSFLPSLWSFPLSPLGTEQRLTDSEGTPFYLCLPSPQPGGEPRLGLAHMRPTQHLTHKRPQSRSSGMPEGCPAEGPGQEFPSPLIVQWTGCHVKCVCVYAHARVCPQCRPCRSALWLREAHRKWYCKVTPSHSKNNPQLKL